MHHKSLLTRMTYALVITFLLTFSSFFGLASELEFAHFYNWQEGTAYASLA
jgi:hypothetical protein